MERLQKILAHGGIASRRTAEQLILDGRVRVNGVIVSELGAKADPRRDRIELDGKRVVAEDHVYVVLHKPRGVVATMSDPEGRPTVQELLKSIPGRVYPVGRLDFATSGVLLATNDGELADGLLHPRKAVPKTYVLKVKGLMKPEDLEHWRRGVRLEDGVTLPAQAKLIRHETDKTWFELTITEGRNQQIRRMGDATGFTVMRLARVAFAEVSAEGLAPGRWRHLTRDELLALRKTYGVPRSLPAAPTIEEGSKRIQAKAVFVRGATKGAAGRATRNAGAEKITARGRFTDPRTTTDENWGERPEASASAESWGASREAESPRGRVPAARGGEDARPSRGARGGDRPRPGAGGRGPAARSDEARGEERGARSGAGGRGAGAHGGGAWGSGGGRGGEERGGDRPRSGAGSRGPGARAGEERGGDRARSGAGGRGAGARGGEAWGSGGGRGGEERGGDRPRSGAGSRGPGARGGDRPRSGAGSRGPGARGEDSRGAGRGAGTRGEDSRGAGRGAGARGEDSRGGGRGRAPDGGRSGPSGGERPNPGRGPGRGPRGGKSGPRGRSK